MIKSNLHRAFSGGDASNKSYSKTLTQSEVREIVYEEDDVILMQAIEHQLENENVRTPLTPNDSQMVLNAMQLLDDNDDDEGGVGVTHQHTNTHVFGQHESQRTNTLKHRIFELLDGDKLQTSVELNVHGNDEEESDKSTSSESEELNNVYAPIKLTKLPSQNDVIMDIGKLQQLKNRFNHKQNASKSRSKSKWTEDEEILAKSAILSLDDVSPSDYEHSRNETTVCISYHDLEMKDDDEEIEGTCNQIEEMEKECKHGSNRSLSRLGFKIPSLFKNGSFSTKSQVKNEKLVEKDKERERRSRSMTDLGDDVLTMNELVSGKDDGDEQGDIVSLLSVLNKWGFYSTKNLNSVQQLACFNDE